MNNTRLEVDQSDCYLNLVSDCASHLANGSFRSIARGHSEPANKQTKKQRPFVDGPAGDDEQKGSILFRIFVPTNKSEQTGLLKSDTGSNKKKRYK